MSKQIKSGSVIQAEDYAAAMLRHMSEKQFMRQVIAYARLRGWRVWHDNATNHRSKCRHCGAWNPGPRNAPGYLDLHLVRGQRQLFIELKREDGTTTPEQRDWLADLSAVPWNEVYVFKPSDWDAVQEVLQ